MAVEPHLISSSKRMGMPIFISKIEIIFVKIIDVIRLKTGSIIM